MKRNINDLLNYSLNNKESFVLSNDIYYLLEKTFSLSRSDLYTSREVDDELYLERLNRLNKGEPIYLILGKAPFYKDEFIVTRDTLIPRPETEELVDFIVKNNKKYNSILDIGTGTGCIGLSIKKYKGGELTLLDISSKALEVAKLNSKELGLDVKFVESNVYENIKDEKYDLIVSNPPYIKDSDIRVLDSSLIDYEPHLALFGGSDGLDIYKLIIKDLDKHLNMNAEAMLEIDSYLVEGLTKLIKEYLPTYQYEFILDINHLTRFLYLKKV